MRRSLLAVSIMVATVCVANPAHADKAEAEKLFRAGEQYFESGRYDMAADAFERAYETLPLPAIGFSAAQAHRLQYFRQKDDSHLKRAVELYRGYVEAQKEGGRIKDAVANLAELEPLLAAAEAKGRVGAVERRTTTQLIITSPIDGAKGSVDGGELVTLPHDVVVDPGRHKVRIEAKGYATYDKDVDVVAGQMRAIEGDLVALPVKVKIKATAGATIKVDGRTVGRAPLEAPLELDGGSHFVTATKRGHRPFSTQFLAERGESLEFDAEMSTTRQRKISYFVLGGGALLLSGSLVAGIAALGSNSQAKDLEDKRQREGLTPAELENYLDAREDRDLAQGAALGLFVTGVALGATGALLYYLDNSQPEERRAKPAAEQKAVNVQPVVGVDSAGVVLSGSF